MKIHHRECEKCTQVEQQISLFLSIPSNSVCVRTRTLQIICAHNHHVQTTTNPRFLCVSSLAVASHPTETSAVRYMCQELCKRRVAHSIRISIHGANMQKEAQIFASVVDTPLRNVCRFHVRKDLIVLFVCTISNGIETQETR